MKARFRKPWQNTIIHAAEALSVYCLFAIFWILPIDTASNLGGWIGRNIANRMGASRKAHKNLRLVYPHKSEDEIKEITKDMWDNLGRNAAETAHLKKLYTAENKKRVEVINEDYLMDAYKQQKGVLIVGAHLANWEIGGLICKANNIPTSAIYRPPNNPHVDKLIKHIRESTTFTLLPKGPQGARGILRELKQKNAVGLLVDQKMNEGINIPLFGLDAMTAPAVAIMAIRTGCIILPAQTIRTRGAHFKMVFHPPIQVDANPANQETETLRVMTEINGMIETWIQAYPSQWLWLHRRFTNEVYGK